MTSGRSEKLGFWELFSIGVGGMIGGGIFAVLGLSLQLSDGAAFLAFLLAGLIALLTSYSYAKLTRRFPSEGGTIEFIVQAYGDNVISGGLNIMLLAAYIVMIALYSHAFGSYGASVLGPRYYREAYAALVILVVSSLTFVNLLGAKTSGRVELALVGFKLSVLIFVVIVAWGMINWGKLSPSNWPPLTNIIAGGMIIFLAYEGFELVSNAAHDASSLDTLARALYASVIVVITVYVLVAIVASGTLTPEQVAKARDYALAIVVEPKLGEAGFLLVVAAALASTGSAINATLYGTARMSYVVAKYGQAPKILGKRVWKGAYEGLLIIAILSLALALGATLDEISTAGSGSFLLVFASVNYAAYKLRRKTRASPALTLLGTLLSVAALLIMLYRMIVLDREAVALFVSLLAGSILVELLYRKITGRTMPRYVDERLRAREELKERWEEWVPRLASELRRVFREAEVYLVGGVARGDLEGSHDVDLLVVTRERLSEEEIRRRLEAARKAARLTPYHPADIHVTTPEEKEKHLARSRAYKRVG